MFELSKLSIFMRKFCTTSLADFFNVTVTTIDIYKVLNALKVSEYYHKNDYFPPWFY